MIPNENHGDCVCHSASVRIWDRVGGESDECPYTLWFWGFQYMTSTIDYPAFYLICILVFIAKFIRQYTLTRRYGGATALLAVLATRGGICNSINVYNLLQRRSVEPRPLGWEAMFMKRGSEPSNYILNDIESSTTTSSWMGTSTRTPLLPLYSTSNID